MVALSDPLTIKMVICFGDALLLTGVKRLFYIIRVFILDKTQCICKQHEDRQTRWRTEQLKAIVTKDRIVHIK